MDKWRNRGAPFTTQAGVEVGRGDVFQAPAMGRTVRMRRHKLRPVPPSTPVTVGEPEEDEDGPEWRYPGVEFLSSRAYRIARRANLALADLEDVEGSGDDGELSAADVREIVDGLGG